MTDQAKRYVFARVLGGFNDMLCQLERVYRYCREHERVMVVDTRLSGLNDDLFRYFKLRRTGSVEILGIESTDWRITQDGEQIIGVDSTDAQLFGRDWRLGHGFDLKTDHPDRILVHATAGGGDLGIFFLEKLRLLPEIKTHLQKAIAPLGSDYLAIHIRNTDWQTDYVSAFKALERMFENRKVLVCSDDSRSILYFHDTYGARCDFVTTSELSNTDGLPLHLTGRGDVYASNLAMLTDLYALALGRQIAMVDTQNTKRSGFAVLAAHMLRRIHPLDSDQAMDLGGRVPSYLRSLRRGTLLRVYRVRERRVGRHFCHPTYE